MMFFFLSAIYCCIGILIYNLMTWLNEPAHGGTEWKKRYTFVFALLWPATVVMGLILYTFYMLDKANGYRD